MKISQKMQDAFNKQKGECLLLFHPNQLFRVIATADGFIENDGLDAIGKLWFAR